MRDKCEVEFGLKISCDLENYIVWSSSVFYHFIFPILSYASLWEQSVKYFSGTQVPADCVFID